MADGESLRQKGNEYYRGGDFRKAIVAYKAAAALGDVKARGNISAALYEAGDYDEALASATEVLSALTSGSEADVGSEKNGGIQLISRLISRMCRLGILQRKWEMVRRAPLLRDLPGASIREMLEILDDGVKCGVMSDNEGMLGGMDGGKPLMKGLMRSTPWTRAFPMNQWSNGSPFSMIDGPVREERGEWLERGKQKLAYGKEHMTELRLDVVERGKNGEEIKILSGGCGDGRHCFETLRDVYLTVKKERLTKKDWPKVHMVVNDIRDETLARAVVMSVLFHKLGSVKEELIRTDMEGFVKNDEGCAKAKKATKRCQKRLEKDKEYAEALDTATLVYHTYMSPFLLPNHQKKLIEVIKSLASTSSSPVPWITTSNQGVWDRLRKVFVYWATDPVDVLALDEHISLPLGQKKIKDDMMARKGVPGNNLNVEPVERMGAVANFPVVKVDTDTMNKISRNGEGEAAMDALPRAQREQIMAAMGMSQRIMTDPSYVAPDFGNSELQSVEGVLEECLIRQEKIIAPPAELWAKYKDYIKLSSKTGKEPRSLKKMWKPNVTAVPFEVEEAISNAYLDDDDAPTTYNHLLENIISISEMTRNNYTLRRGFFDHVSFWFVEVGAAVKNLADAGLLKLEFDLGDMHELAARQERKSFDVCNGSNCMDYTHTLNSLVFFAPLLREKGRPGLMIQDIRVAPEIFTHLTEFVHSATLLTSMDEMKSALNISYAGGSLFGPLPYWSIGRGAKLSRSALEAWLQRLLLSITYPPEIGSTVMSREIYSFTLVAFFEVLVRLVDEVGYPKHWIAHFLETVIQDKFMTSANAPTQSPNPLRSTYDSYSREKKEVNMDPIIPEFTAVLTYYAYGRLPLGVCVRLSKPHWYKWPKSIVRDLNICGIKPGEFMSFACVGLVLLDPRFKDISFKYLTNLLRECRRNINKFGENDISIFTSVRLRCGTQRDDNHLSIYMTEMHYAAMAKHGFTGILIRVDSWEPLWPLHKLPLALATPESD